MALLYTLYQWDATDKKTGEPINPSAQGKWFARACQIGEMGTDELAERVSYATTVTKADVKAVIEGLIKEMQDAMNNSQTVVLDGIGRFKLGITCTGAIEPGDFNANTNITGVHVNFLPAYNNTKDGRKNSPWTNRTKCREAPKNAVE